MIAENPAAPVQARGPRGSMYRRFLETVAAANLSPTPSDHRLVSDADLAGLPERGAAIPAVHGCGRSAP